MNVEKVVLWASLEDYCGLWELVWEVNTLHPNLSKKESQHVALQCILPLILQDFVRLFYCQEPYGQMTEIVDWHKYTNLLHDLKAWEPPLPETRSIRVAATKSGETYYNGINFLGACIKKEHC